MQAWMPYHFFSNVPCQGIKELQGQAVTAVCACSGSLLFSVGENQSEIFSASGYDQPAQRIGLSFDGPVVHMVSAQFSPRLLIVTHEAGTFIFRVYNYHNFSLRYELRCVGQSIHFIATSPKMSRIAFTLNRRDVVFYSLPKVDRGGDLCVKLATKPNQVQTMPSNVTAIFLTNDNRMNKYAFIACETEIIAVSGERAMKVKHLDTDGYAPADGQQTAIVDSKGRLYLCRVSTVSVYSAERKLEREFVLDIERPGMLFWFRQYLVATGKPDTVLLKVYETKSHCVFGVVPGSPTAMPVKFLFAEWSKLNMIMEDGSLIVLNEPNTETKINQLCGRFNQYDVALSLARSHKLGPAVVASIHHSKGDQYYERRSYDEAISEYIQAIGSLESSYVIKRFLDPQHAQYLIRYVEALQNQNIATSESNKKLQTTLLFSCYTKLRRADTITERIQEAISDNAKGQCPHFDIDAAIDVLHQGGYFDQCSILAKEFSRHETFMKLLSEAGTVEKYQELAEYFAVIPISLAEVAVLKYGPLLLGNLDDDRRSGFADIVAVLCTVGGSEIDPKSGVEVFSKCNADHFRTVFALYPSICIRFLRNLVSCNSSCVSAALWNDYIMCAIRVSPAELESIMSNPAAKYSTEQAMIALQEVSLTIDEQMKSFARAIKAGETSPEIEEVRTKADYIRRAMRILYERRHLYMEIVSAALPEELPELCESYGAVSPVIWNEGLRRAVASKNKAVIARMLELVFEKDVMPLASVLPLFKRSVESFDLIQSYAEAELGVLMNEISEREATLAKLDQQLEESEDTVRGLSAEYYGMNPKGKCKQCNLPLSAPCRYFMCGDAFHLQCLGDETQVCTTCKDSHLAIAQKKLDVVESVASTPDVFSISSADPVLAALQSGYFWVADGGAADVNQFISQIKKIDSDRT